MLSSFFGKNRLRICQKEISLALSCSIAIHCRKRLKTRWIDAIFTRELLEKGTEESRSPLTHCLPDYIVITPQKATTKIRIVYAAPAQSSKRICILNECL